MKKIILLILALVLFSINQMYACVCVELNESLGKKVTKAFLKADLIFVGKVLNQEFKNTEIYVPELNSKQLYSRTIYTFVVIDEITGQTNKKSIEVVTTSDSCGMSFQLGETYLIYARKHDRRITFSSYLNQEKVESFYATSLCTRTEKANEVKKKEIRKLKQLAKRKR